MRIPLSDFVSSKWYSKLWDSDLLSMETNCWLLLQYMNHPALYNLYWSICDCYTIKVNWNNSISTSALFESTTETSMVKQIISKKFSTYEETVHQCLDAAGAGPWSPFWRPNSWCHPRRSSPSLNRRQWCQQWPAPNWCRSASENQFRNLFSYTFGFKLRNAW